MSHSVDAIRIIITGGTFDKDYDPLSGTLTFRDTHIVRILEEVRLGVPVELEINQLTDSLQMSDEQRMGVVEACIAAPERRVIVTHGTDTMTVTAALVQERLAIHRRGGGTDSRQKHGVGRVQSTPGTGPGEYLGEKAVVFTGAMVPYSVSGSDALFNLGCAVGAVQLVDPGVYVVMNGRVFPAGQVSKNRTNGKFEVRDEG